MDTDKYISLDNLDYFAGKFKDLIEDTTVPSVKLEPSGGRDYIQRSDIKDLGEGSFICYIDENNRYRVGSTEYIYGPALFFTSYSVVDLGEGDKDNFDFLVLSPTVAKRYKTNQDDPSSFTYSWVDYVTSDNAVNSISEISSDSSIAALNINSPIGVVTNSAGITISWVDYTSSTSETMLLPYNTFILGNTSEAIVDSGDVQILMPDGKRYNVSNLTATAATVTEITAAYMKQLAVATYNTSTFAEVIDMVEANKLVYCKVSIGGGFRYAVIAFKDNSKVEFNYVRKTNDGNNELWIYTIDRYGTWTTVSMPISRRIVAGNNMTSSYNASTNTLTLNATGGGSSLDITEISTAGSYQPSSFTTTSKTLVTVTGVILAFAEDIFGAQNISYALPKGTEVTYDGTDLYFDTHDGFNFKLEYYNSSYWHLKPDMDQPYYQRRNNGYSYLFYNSSLSTDYRKQELIKLINQTFLDPDIDHISHKPMFKRFDTDNGIVPIVFTFNYNVNNDYVQIQIGTGGGAVPTSSTSGTYNYGVNYSYIYTIRSVAFYCIKKSEFITRSVTEIYTDTSCTTAATFIYLSTGTKGYYLNNQTEILGRNNFTAWTPTGDYNPATKKYVDDHSPDFTFTLSNSSSNNKGTSSANAIDLNTLIKGHKYRYVNSGGSTTYFYYKYNLGSSDVNKSLRVDSQMSSYTSVTFQEQYMYWNRVDIEMLANVSDFSNLVVNQPIAILTFDYGDGTFAPNNNTKNVRVEAVIYKSSSTAMAAACTWGHFNNYGLASVLNSINGDASSAIQQCSALDTRVTALEQGGGGSGGETIVAAGSVDGSGMTHISWQSSAYSNYALSVAVNASASEFTSLSISVSDPNHSGGTIPSSGKFIIKLKDSVNDSVLTTIDVGQLTLDGPSQMFTITDYVPATSCNIEMYETSGSGDGIPVVNFSDISTESTGYTYLDMTSIEALGLSTGDSVFVKQDTTIELNTGSATNVIVYPSLWCLTKSEDSMKSTVYSLRQVTEGYGSATKRILSFEISGSGGMTNIMGFAYNATSI